MKWLIILSIILAAVFIGWGKKSKDDESDMSEFDKSMDEFRNQETYTELNSDILITISDDKLEQTIIDYISSKFNEDYSNDYQIVTSLSPGLKAIYSTWILEAEVNNGGFNQFYWNSSGQFADEAEAGLSLIGASEHFELMKEANEIHEKEKEKMQKYKDQGTLSAFSEFYKESKLNTIDDKFYDLREDLSELRIKYIRSNIDEFLSE